MKVIVNGKEIELKDTLEEGEKELDMLTPEEKKSVDLEDTLEITEEMINQITNEGEKYYD